MGANLNTFYLVEAQPHGRRALQLHLRVEAVDAVRLLALVVACEKAI